MNQPRIRITGAAGRTGAAARLIAAVLVTPDAHDGHTYRPAGPRLLNAADTANTLQTVLNRSADSTYSIDSPNWRAPHQPTNRAHDKDHAA